MISKFEARLESFNSVIFGNFLCNETGAVDENCFCSWPERMSVKKALQDLPRAEFASDPCDRISVDQKGGFERTMFLNGRPVCRSGLSGKFETENRFSGSIACEIGNF